MAKGAKGGLSAKPHKSGGTGLYVVCPGSGSLHPPYGREVLRSGKGKLWLSCPTCGFRGYFDRGGTPGVSRQKIEQLGAVVPDAIGMA
jgi:hypothetical protein